jgi:hypothetical protein
MGANFADANIAEAKFVGSTGADLSQPMPAS